MPYRKKGISKKIIVAVILISALVVAAFALLYAQEFMPVQVVAGVNVGDTFTYSLQGNSVLTSLDAVEPPQFAQFNQTDYYKVAITDVNGSTISLNTEWRFINGTAIYGNQTIDLATGMQTNDNGFWAIYAANLNKNNLLRPRGFDKLIVNNTDTKTFADSTRSMNVWTLDNQFFDTTDPTGSTQQYVYIYVTFDKKTGMLVSLTNVEAYNNPQYTLATTWKLIDSSVWKVQ